MPRHLSTEHLSTERSRASTTRSRAGLVLVLAAVLASGAAGALTSCSPSGADGERDAVASGARAREVPRVRVAPIERRPMERVHENTRVIESDTEVRLFPRLAGTVVEVLAEEGDRVEAGQPLARIDVREQENAVKEAEVALREATESEARLQLLVREAEARTGGLRLAAEQAERDYERDARLATGETVASGLSQRALEASKLVFDNATAELATAVLAEERARIEAVAAQTAIRSAELALERCELLLSFGAITSPIDGVVAQRDCRVGQTLTAAEPAFVVTDPEALRAVLPRPQAELPIFAAAARGADANAAARGGQANAAGAQDNGLLRVTATSDAVPGATFRGRVERTSPTIDAASGSFRVTIRFEPLAVGADPEAPNPPRLLPGMLVRLRIVTDRHEDALVVPKRALDREGEELFVLRVVDGAVERIDVIEGYASEEHVEVIDPEGSLAPGDEIVVVGSRALEDGARVEVERAPEEAGS